MAFPAIESTSRRRIMLLPANSRLSRPLVILLIVVFVLIISWSLVPTQSWTDGAFKFAKPSSRKLPDDATETLSLPPIYSQTGPKLTDCLEKSKPPFLQSASNTSVNYCTDTSSSRLVCVRSHASTKRTDSFCIGTPAVFKPEESKFELGCSLRELTDQEVAAGVPDMAQFPTYWYETGTRLILNTHVNLEPSANIQSYNEGRPKNYTILVRREAPIDNLFHHFMQIFSIYLTLDVLQLVLDPMTGGPFFRAADIDNTRVVIFDDHEEGPFFDQWTAFAKRPVTRINDLKVDPTLSAENIIVPLPGVANPFWSGDWEAVIRDCDEVNLVKVFAQRILEFYDVQDEQGPPDRPLVLTFIDRREKRSLVNKETYIEDLKTLYPNVQVNLVNFASLSFAEQLRTIRKTDILAGVHGAGLTHEIFLQPGSSVVEIMPHSFNHKGFRNLARGMGHRYFTTHAIEHSNYSTSKGWQFDDVFIEQGRFNGLMDAGIKSMYHRGLRNDDVN